MRLYNTSRTGLKSPCYLCVEQNPRFLLALKGEDFTRKILDEWRCFIIDGKVCSASQYRTYFVLNTRAGAPQEVIDFAEEQSKLYKPSDIFVMDVCKCGKFLYVLEVGCFNSAGFYEANIEKIVYTTSKHLEEKCQNLK